MLRLPIIVRDTKQIRAKAKSRFTYVGKWRSSDPELGIVRSIRDKESYYYVLRIFFVIFSFFFARSITVVTFIGIAAIAQSLWLPTL